MFVGIGRALSRPTYIHIYIYIYTYIHTCLCQSYVHRSSMPCFRRSPHGCFTVQPEIRRKLADQARAGEGHRRAHAAHGASLGPGTSSSLRLLRLAINLGGGGVVSCGWYMLGICRENQKALQYLGFSSWCPPPPPNSSNV